MQKTLLICPIVGRRYGTSDVPVRVSRSILHIVALIYVRWREKKFTHGELRHLLAETRQATQQHCSVEASVLISSGYVIDPAGRNRRGVSLCNKSYVLAHYAMEYLHKNTEPVSGFRDGLLSPQAFRELAVDRK